MFVFQDLRHRQTEEEKRINEIRGKLIGIFQNEKTSFSEKRSELSKYLQALSERDKAYAAEVLCGTRSTTKNWGRAATFDSLFIEGERGFAGDYYSRWKAAVKTGSEDELSSLEAERRLLFHAVSYVRSAYIQRELIRDHSPPYVRGMDGDYHGFNDCMDYAQKLDAFLFCQLAPTIKISYDGQNIPLCEAIRLSGKRKKRPRCARFIAGKSTGWRFTSRSPGQFIVQDDEVDFSKEGIREAMKGCAVFKTPDFAKPQPFALAYRTMWAESLSELKSHLRVGDLVFVPRSPNNTGSGHTGIVGKDASGKLVIYDQNSSGVWQVESFCKRMLKRNGSFRSNGVKIYRPLTSVWGGQFVPKQSEKEAAKESQRKESESPRTEESQKKPTKRKFGADFKARESSEAKADVKEITSSGLPKNEQRQELLAKAEKASKRARWAVYHIYNDAASVVKGGRETPPVQNARKYGKNFRASSVAQAEADVKEIKASNVSRTQKVSELAAKAEKAAETARKDRHKWPIWHIYNNAAEALKRQSRAEILESVPSLIEKQPLPQKPEGTA